jgi:hypothetical protein
MQTWTAPAGTDLWQIVSKKVVEKVDEDSAGGTVPGNDLDTSLDSRAKQAVAHAVAEVRGAIEACGRYPVSATAGTVPPEGVNHTLAIAAWRLCLPVPSLLAILMADGGMFSPITTLYRDACKWVDGLRAGGSFTEPTDPCGVDYETEVSASNPAVSGIRWGDSLADGDEYAAGITDDGVVVSRFSQNMNTQ